MPINEDKQDIVEKLVGVIIKVDREKIVEKMMGPIINAGKKDIKKKGNKIIGEALKIKNEGGNGPLHRAAARGSVTMCDCILQAGVYLKRVREDSSGKEDPDLLSITNNWEETPIFVAALHNHKQSFIFLH